MKTSVSLTLVLTVAAALLSTPAAKAQFYPTAIGCAATNTNPYSNVGRIILTFR